jgi:hypothetical protein
MFGLGQIKLRHAVEIGQQTAYLAGNATLIGQTIAGAYTMGEGGCAIVDGYTCPVPGVSLCYFGGGACQLVGGSCLVASACTGAICPPAGWTIAGLGYALRKVGNYVIDKANIVNPAPSITKIV